jgi:hypothetical protein
MDPRSWVWRVTEHRYAQDDRLHDDTPGGVRTRQSDGRNDLTTSQPQRDRSNRGIDRTTDRLDTSHPPRRRVCRADDECDGDREYEEAAEAE